MLVLCLVKGFFSHCIWYRPMKAKATSMIMIKVLMSTADAL
jgi:hypothetical protein